MEKNIILKELTVSNFRGQNFKDTYGDNTNTISGRNASGKSTRISAFQWLLSGYTDANSPANSRLFDDRLELTPQTPTASVKAIVSINGEDYTLERTATASFSRKRGTNEYVKNPSDSYGYKIDSIDRTATSYKEWLDEHITPEDMIRFVLDGQYFVNMVFEDKKRARQLIEKLIGEVKRDEMQGDYSLIDELLAKYSLDEIEERAANLCKGINQRLNEIPSLIHSKETEIAEIEQTDFVAIDNEIASLEYERTNLDKRMTDLTERVRPQMEARHNAEREKAMKEDIYNKAFADWSKEKDAARKKLMEEIEAVNKQNSESKRLYLAAKDRVEEATAMRDSYMKSLMTEELHRERLLKERDLEKAKTISPLYTKCSYCGAELQGEKLQEVVERFENVKRENINRIVLEGKRTAAEIERLNKKINECQDIIDTPLPEIVEQSTADLDKKLAEVSKEMPTPALFALTDLAKNLQEDIDAVVIPEVIMPDNSEIVARKAVVNNTLTPLYEKRGLKTRIETLKKTIVELQSEQREIGAELAQYERQRQLVKDYKQEQMQILSNKVNDGLKFSRLDIWSKQKDGTLVPDLVLRDAQGVSYATTNNASRIITTVDVQRFFCEKLGVNMPIFVDESSVLNTDNLPKFENTQMFYLFCSDTSLKIESK